MCIRDRYICVQWISNVLTTFYVIDTITMLYRSPAYFLSVTLCCFLVYTFDHFFQIWEFHITQPPSDFCRLWAAFYNPSDHVTNKNNFLELIAVSYTHLRAHETREDLVCRLLLEKKKPSKY
eukprot:TRINITY_DN18648_c0_g1_i1.p1 TRINITY_DN18648_c0_g1~~TRINITY_DN18648_c0_g1_i1.p1  ORF type:complete len:122 (+),score=28.02 TRINITY_DN18648_c0_g1_i1:55-420(+)